MRQAGRRPGAPQGAVEKWTTERCYITEILNNDGSPQLSVAKCRVEPGVTTELHSLDVHECYIVIEGEGLMELNREKTFRIRPSDVVNIPSGTPQRVTNDTDNDLQFYCVCAPRFVPACYRSLESIDDQGDV